MDIQRISSEQHLRDWLSERIFVWNQHHYRKVKLEWIEPTFGSSMGISDCNITFAGEHYGVELKHFITRKDGVHYKIRPVQRRYNFMGVRAGRKLLIFATVVRRDAIEMVMIRGDNVPMRDYCYIDGSGCQKGVTQTVIPLDGGNVRPFEFFIETLASPSWWEQQPLTEHQ